ncbi:MAG: tetratricopeptide repeat protein [Chloroflexi bacterium]|nr:tetratricopeptide repeat protein [Chloroflexota bacterium]
MAELSLPLARRAVASLLAASDLDRAAAALAAILTVYPRDYRSAVLAGRLELAQGDPAKAFLSFQQAAEADPEDRRAREGMAACGGQEGSVVLGDLPPLGSSGNGSSRPPISAVALGHLYLRQLLLTHCTAQLTPLWHSHRQRLDVGVALAEAHWRLRETEAAEAVCRELLELAPENLKANLILAQQAWAAGQRAVAEPYLDRARALDPENELAEELYEWLRVRDEALVPLRYTPVRVAIPDGVPVGPEAPVRSEEPVQFWSPRVGVPVAGRLGVLRRPGVPMPAPVAAAPAAGLEPRAAATPESRERGEPVAAGRGAPPTPESGPVRSAEGAAAEPPALEPLQPETDLAEPVLEADLLATQAASPGTDDLPATAAAPATRGHAQPSEPTTAEPPMAPAGEPRLTDATAAEASSIADSAAGELPGTQEQAPEAAAASTGSDLALELGAPQPEEEFAEADLEAQSPAHPATEALKREVPGAMSPREPTSQAEAGLPRAPGAGPALDREPAQPAEQLPEPIVESALPPAAAQPAGPAAPEAQVQPVVAPAEPAHEPLEPETPAVQEPVLVAPVPSGEANSQDAAVAATAPEPAVQAVEPAPEVGLVEVSSRGALGAARSVGGATARAGATWDHSCRALGQAWRLGALVSSSVESEHGAAQLLHGASGVDVLAVAPPGANLGLLRTALRRGQASTQEAH